MSITDEELITRLTASLVRIPRPDFSDDTPYRMVEWAGQLADFLEQRLEKLGGHEVILTPAEAEFFILHLRRMGVTIDGENR